MEKQIRGLILAALLLGAGMAPHALAFQAGSTAATQTQAQSEGSASQTKPPAPPPASQADIDKLVQEKVREALSQNQGRRSDPNPEMSPETEKAISQAVQKFLDDPSVKDAITEKIHQFDPPGRREMFAGIMIPIAAIAFAGLVVWFRFRGKQASLRAQMDMQTQLLSKFNAGTDLAAFLGSPGGQQFLSGLSSARMNTHSRVIRHAGSGALCTALGLGMMLFGRGASFPGVVILSVGIGLLISAFLTQRLSSKMETGGPNTNLPPAPPAQ